MVFATSPSSFSSLRFPLIKLAKLGTSFPIEVIVTVFCAATLVYFQIIKVSSLSHTPRFLGTHRSEMGKVEKDWLTVAQFLEDGSNGVKAAPNQLTDVSGLLER